MIEYEVVFNPEGVLLNDGNPIELKDEIEFDAKSDFDDIRIVDGTVQIEQSVTGNPLNLVWEPLPEEDWSYSYSSAAVPSANPNDGKKMKINTLIFKVPDGTPVRIKYKYYIDFLDVHENGSAQKQVKNKISSHLIKTEKSSETNIQCAAGAWAKSNAVTFEKYDSENAKIKLAGAAFKVQKYTTHWEDLKAEVEDPATGKTTMQTVTFETSSQSDMLGEYIYNNFILLLEENVLYRLVETKAPDGYIKPTESDGSDKGVYYFYKKNLEASPNLPPEASEALPVYGGSTIYLENERHTTSLQVEKSWIDEDGNPIEDDQLEMEEIKIKLFQISGPKDNPSRKEYGEYTISKQHYWKRLIDNLPVDDPDNPEIPYRYEIEEISVPGWISSQKRITEEETDKIMLTNKKGSNEYELPTTGGSWISWTLFLIIGSVLAVLASGILVRKRYQ